MKRHKMLYFQTYFDAHKMRISFEERYFSFNRMALLAAGLWPYQQSKFARLQLVLFLGILISFITFQVYRYPSLLFYNLQALR